ncbi:MAG: hypothetical protein GF408_07215 [Candidatus Omnitrophica bacterium]|nr:hypothetical protein [Candidatus Omnitrophota bacterium]
MDKKLFWTVFAGIMLMNYGAIHGSIALGLGEGNVSYFFQERETVTFLSSLQLALAGLSSVFIYSLRKITYRNNATALSKSRIWLIAFFLLALASADEFFMLHEGIDGGIVTWVFGDTANPHLDGLTLSLYGMAALWLFYRFRDEIVKYKSAMTLFFICGILFLVSITLDLRSVDHFRIVLEESFKLSAVGFLLSGFISILLTVYEDLKKTVAAS